MKDLSVVIPAYNEAAAIQAGKLKAVVDWFHHQTIPVEVIVVDDGSQDDTAALARRDADRVLSIPHAGKAAAIAAGIRTAQGEVILFSDMDQATPIYEAERLLAALEAGADISIGSRGLVRAGAPLGRYLLSWGQIVLRSLLIGLYLTDTQCGFKAFTRAAALDVLENLRLYHPDKMGEIQGASVTSGFDVEFLFVAQRLGYRIKEVRVTWNYQQTRRVRLLRDALRGVNDLFQIAFADLRGQYIKCQPVHATNPHAVSKSLH